MKNSLEFRMRFSPTIAISLKIFWSWLWITGVILAACTSAPPDTPERMETQSDVQTQALTETPTPEPNRVLLPLIFQENSPGSKPSTTQQTDPSGQGTGLSPFGLGIGLPDFSATIEAELYGPPTQAAKQALAYLKGVPVSAIFLVQIEPTTWANTCLEVPASGLPCQNFQTPGFLIVLRLNGDLFEYRTDVTGGRVAAYP